MISANILGVKVAVTNMKDVVEDIGQHLEEYRGEYICVANVHTTITAYDDPVYMAIQNDAVYAIPDGAPLAAYQKGKGYREAERVTGPDLMQELLKRGGRHLFYGSKKETLDKLRTVINERYKAAVVVDMIAPPYRALTDEEDEGYIKRINDAKPDYVWVGLGAPKQEKWMSVHKNKVNSLMIGVGAAFNFECGNIKRAPMWMQKCSLEWLYRLLQNPKKLFKRYLITNTKWIWLTRVRRK